MMLFHPPVSGAKIERQCDPWREPERFAYKAAEAIAGGLLSPNKRYFPHACMQLSKFQRTVARHSFNACGSRFG